MGNKKDKGSRSKSPTMKNPGMVGGENTLPQKESGGVDYKKTAALKSKEQSKSWTEKQGIKKSENKSKSAPTSSKGIHKLKETSWKARVAKSEPAKSTPAKGISKLKVSAQKSKPAPKAPTKKPPTKGR
jgi:hypothetical protein